MTTIELEARKAMLVKEILTDINSEEMLDKLAGYLKRLKKTATGLQVAPCQYTRDEMESILLEREKETHSYTQEQVKKEMKNLITSWK